MPITKIKQFPLSDEIGFVELLYSMGNDLSVVNDARASYDNESFKFDEKDERLLKYLIKNEHWSPFRGVVFKFRVKAPLFLCRQWWKHHVSSSYVDCQNQWNELSMRYVDMGNKAEFYMPYKFREQSKSNKQKGSVAISKEKNDRSRIIYKHQCESAFTAYKTLIELGVCREQARGLLPTSIYTTFIWTVSLQALLNFIELRKGSGAQDEITAYAYAIEKMIEPIVPVTMKYWSKDKM